MAAPVKAPALSATWPLRMALMLADKSGAPLPMATKVTPANLGRILGMVWDTSDMVGLKYNSAVLPSRQNSSGSTQASSIMNPPVANTP
eukprot:CAMPEP_0202411182 /NCGR_PEP_ID=MMETSP1128-20130828/21131_1 /ASSEMBLY_ACC=CAM_ASM_000463 /TAXON_ID=3047 /ORGANISM="Dunaliella tertiolecta, Strain CCMP1320" /LENGTH=88 /DNA_ID=CAMNT_0049016833 /DNA_START=99 /DNA_END=365 /DNA_ORIENTATION=-